uniref:SAM-dependent MTase RsmB/NOP-type domain-containing protein n=1 Tax=Chenopodium quinoa TaxID=63459 RepID=A0A803KW44_CHEQI
MGGRGRSRTQRKHFKQSRDNVWKNGSKSDASSAAADGENNSGDAERKTRENWEPLKTQNAEQGIVAPEEWDDFMECLRKPLPAAFRINSSSQFCLDIRSQLEDDFVKSLQSEFTGDEAEALRPLPWYPETLAWHSEFSRKQLRKTQTLERFHEFLKLAHEIGNITRQEAVSMVPPLFLDVHPNHFVLDTPGSKTFQLLEIIHRANEPGSLPTGMVVANDVDIQRSNLLIHQTKRMCTANLIVTNHEAQDFPGCRLSKFHHNSSDIQSEKGLSINQLDFDRVLCDVPCSGDGTLRKAPDIWRKWNVGMGNGLHCLQLKIAMRGISLLKVGGRMVYSTCSMNPVENEAVVAEILRRCGDSLELLDVSNELPLLVRRPGLKKWKVRDKGLWLSSYKDVPKYRRPSVLSSMFPSGRNIVDSSEDSGDHVVAEAKEDDKNEIVQPNTAPLSEVNDDEISSLPLERCMRIVPHDQNCGAFFIAVFHKHSPFPVVQEKNGENVQLLHKSEESAEGAGEIASNLNDVSEAKLCEATSVGNAETDAGSLADVPSPKLEEEVAEDQQDLDKEETSPKNVGKKRKLQTQGKWKGVDPVILFKDETVINSIKAFYGIDDSFPLNGHVVTRNNDTDSVKRIYYISKSVKEVLELNLLVGQQLKIASVGLKMFERQTSKDGNATECRYRISSEGLPVLLPYITKQILLAPIVDFKHLLQYKSIKFDALVDAELVEAASKLELGCCVVVLKEADQVSSFPIQVKSSTIAIGCWRGRSNLNVMVTGLDCKDLLERLEKRMETGNAEIAEPQNGGVNGDSNPNDTDMKEESKNDVDMKDEETVNMVEL